MRKMNAKVSRMIARGFAKFSKSFAQSIFGFSLPEKKIKRPMMERNRERTSGKIAGPGWVNLPIGSLIERKKNKSQQKGKIIPRHGLYS